jgi:hypothetical protein
LESAVEEIRATKVAKNWLIDERDLKRYEKSRDDPGARG